MPQTPHAPPSVRARIGGRWAITSWLVGIAALFTLIPALAPVGGIDVNPLTTADPTIVGVAAQVGAVCAVILIAHLTIFRHRAEHPVPVWWVFALGVAGGVVRR
jgi:sterol desaturase/sphingolipid hydroxylase (fatty acid hydroxylase superfamily)